MNAQNAIARRYQEAQGEVWFDSGYWEQLATGQDSEEAEESGRLAGYAEGLAFAFKTLTGVEPQVSHGYLEKRAQAGRAYAEESLPA